MMKLTKEYRGKGRETFGLSLCLWQVLIALCFWGLTGCTKTDELIVMTTAKASNEIHEEVETQENATTNENETTKESTTTQEEVAAKDKAAPKEDVNIYVHLCGAVHGPGVYKLPQGARLFEAIELAGGFLEAADAEYVNLAEVLADGMKIQIPTKEQTAALKDLEAKNLEDEATAMKESWVTGGESKQQGDAFSGNQVDLNSADEATLCTITGIGPTRARAIIDNREARGRFEHIEDIMRVEGIKQGTFDKIKNQICVK